MKTPRRAARRPCARETLAPPGEPRAALLSLAASLLLACASPTPTAKLPDKGPAVRQRPTAHIAEPDAAFTHKLRLPREPAPTVASADTTTPGPLRDPVELLEEGPVSTVLLYDGPALLFDDTALPDDVALAGELERTAPKRVLIVTERSVPEARRAAVVGLLGRLRVPGIAMLVADDPRPEETAIADPPVRGAVPAAPPTRWTWACGFPKKADDDKVDTGVVRLVVRVGNDGRALGVKVLEASGHGFGAAATACAFTKRYRPALDAEGTPTEGTTNTLRIRFAR